MIEKLKKQSIGKLFIMLWNVFRMTALKIRFRKKARISFIQNLHPSTEIAVKNGVLTLAHSVFTRRNVSFRAEGGELFIGTSFFNQGCCVTCMKKIEIGCDCLFGPNVVIVDHDHDYSFLDNQRGNHYLTNDIRIGNNVWVGANVTILRGSVIGDNCVIGAGCVVKGVVEPDTVLISKQNQTCKKICKK